MIQLSRNFNRIARILIMLSIIGFIVFFILNFFIPLHMDLNLRSLEAIEDLVPFYLFICFVIAWIIFAFYIEIKMANVKCDGKYFYIENIVRSDKVPVTILESYCRDFKGINLLFKTMTKLGTRIFFSVYFSQRKDVIKYLDKLINTVKSE
jgi:hypothetical protein